MIRKFTLLFAVICTSFIMAQQNETCESPVEEVLLDANSITKCSIEEKKDDKASAKSSKSFSVQVSSRRRVKRKRKEVSSNSGLLTSNSVNSVEGNSVTDEGTNLVDNSSISSAYLNEKVIEKIPFSHVQETPLLEKCLQVSILDQKKCVHKEINNHIKNNFKYPKEAYSKSIQGRVLVQFVIDKTGSVTDLNVRSPYKGELLEAEARRIIKTLPKFTPGKHNGEVVKVKYGIPISFKIPGKAPSNVKEVSKNVKLNEVHNFTGVDVIPTFKKCSKSNDLSNDCFNEAFMKHINKYFAYPVEAIEKNIEGKVIAYFVIDSKGQVVNVKTRAASGKDVLEKATKELIEKLPNFTPGKHKGKTTNVKHAFPVSFKLN